MHKVTFILLVIGGLNWLLTGLWVSWDLALYITDWGARIVYLLVGLSAIYEIYAHKRLCKNCTPAA